MSMSVCSCNIISETPLLSQQLETMSLLCRNASCVYVIVNNEQHLPLSGQLEVWSLSISDQCAQPKIAVQLLPIHRIAPLAANNLQSGLSSTSSVASSTLRL